MIARAANLVPMPGLGLDGLNRELLWLLARRGAQGAMVGITLGASHVSSTLPLVIDAGESIATSFTAMAIRPAIETAVLAIMLTLALRVPHGMRRLSAVVLAIVAGGVLGWLIPSGLGDGFFERGDYDMIKIRMQLLWLDLVVGVAMAAFFASWDRTRDAIRALHAAQLAQQRAEHGVLEARLNVMRARVDPEFLFEAMRGAQRLYGADRAAAERLMDNFIQYLRATLPQSRENASTLAQEAHLAQAYLEVCSALGDRRISLASDIAPAFATAFFPPRVIAPLIEDAVRRAGSGNSSIRLRATLEGSQARVSIEDEGFPGAEPPRGLDEIAMTLKAFFGTGARAAWRDASPGRVVTLEFPAHGIGNGKEAP